MPRFSTADQAVRAAIQNNGFLRVFYRNNQGNESSRILRPLRWDNNYVFVAYCYSRNEERSFKLSNVLEYQYFDTLAEATASQQGAPQPPAVAPAAAPNTKLRPVVQKSQPAPTAHTPLVEIDHVSSRDGWSRLVKYYTDCLEQENRQAYILEKNECVPLGLDAAACNQLMQSKISLEIEKGLRLQRNQVADFIEKVLKAKNLQLCIGYPFFVTPQLKIAPIVFSAINVRISEDRYYLTAESFDLSYAALHELELSEEEIDLFTTKYEGILAQNNPEVVQGLQLLMISKLCEIYQVKNLPSSNGETPGTLIHDPMLFSVESSTATRLLIEELKDLSEPANWDVAPVALKQLLNSQPPHILADALPAAEDPGLYVTPAYEQQTRAAQAARREPVMVVTGPPGTGKSQLVLNLVAQAYMNGESVLFASRNNQAVDVVMNRLQNEMQFQGAIRSGNKEYRLKAARQMRQTLGLVAGGASPYQIENLQRDYHGVREQLLESLNRLQEIKNLSGLLQSLEQERALLIHRMPEPLHQNLRENLPDFFQADWDTLQATLSSLIDQVLVVKQERQKLEKALRQIETGVSPVVREMTHFQDQWGAFGGGFLKKSHYDSLTELARQLETWLTLTEYIEQFVRLRSATAAKERQEAEWLAAREPVSEGLHPKITEYAQRFDEASLGKYANQFKRLAGVFQKSSEKRPNLWDRLLARLGIRNPKKRNLQTFFELQHASGMPEVIPAEIALQTEKDLALVCSGIGTFFKACRENNLLRLSEGYWQQTCIALQAQREKLPSAIADDFDRLPVFEMDTAGFKAQLEQLKSSLNTHQSQMLAVVERVNAKLGKNEDKLKMLASFQASPTANHPLLRPLHPEAEPEIVFKYLTLWRDVISYWKAHLSFVQVEKQLNLLPSEACVVDSVKEINARLLSLSSEILRATWNDRARASSNEVIYRATEYANSVEELAKDYNPATYWQLKANEDQGLKYAVQLFPVWAVTNLSAKSNFPLQNSFFDLVILDEASQCDIPSALPLLFRAKRIVVIGDPNQLKHVATLKTFVNQKLAAKYGISLGAYSYKINSLFDIAQRSAGTNPGTILLNEHYRSDARIIGFSNQEFYDNRLKIKTDLSLKGIRKTFLNTYGGIFWINVNGRAQRPTTGGAYNEEEVASISQLIPALQTFLLNSKMDGASVGVVTPYVHQERRLKKWVSQFYGSELLTVGTAHKFQGDERDFMVFSAVLANGSTKGSIDWLKREKNLLNVAVTRARIGLIVVGDYNFCRQLPQDHCFRQLADYVSHEPGRVVQNYRDLQLFGKTQTSIVGTILDPHNPEYNRITLRRYLAACREFVWWADSYFNQHVADLFLDVFQDTDVNLSEIHLLTASEQLDGVNRSKPQVDVEAIHHLITELNSRGIDFEMRTLPRREIPHDRLLYTQGDAVNMPPFAGAYGDHHHVSEYTRTNTDLEFFKQYWDKAKPV